jgi:hypothetical protein
MSVAPDDLVTDMASTGLAQDTDETQTALWSYRTNGTLQASWRTERSQWPPWSSFRPCHSRRSDAHPGGAGCRRRSEGDRRQRSARSWLRQPRRSPPPGGRVVMSGGLSASNCIHDGAAPAPARPGRRKPIVDLRGAAKTPGRPLVRIRVAFSRVHAQPPLQLGNLRLELLDPLGLPHHEGRQLLIGRTPASRHPAMIDKTRRRSSSHAADLTGK